MKEKAKVIHIYEPDFGCEGRPDGYVPKDTVILESENGAEITVYVPDEELIAKDIDEGTTVIYNSETGEIFNEK